MRNPKEAKSCLESPAQQKKSGMKNRSTFYALAPNF